LQAAGDGCKVSIAHAVGGSPAYGATGAQLVVSATLFAVMATAAKEASALGGAEVAFLRSVMGVFACVLTHVFVRPLVARNRFGLVSSGSSGALAVYAYFLAIEHLPVGIAALLTTRRRCSPRSIEARPTITST
jgi:drug/metabolite transporter (DMT)-like permease